VTGLSELLLTNVGSRVRLTNDKTDECFYGTLALDPMHVGKLVLLDEDDGATIPLFHDDEIELT